MSNVWWVCKEEFPLENGSMGKLQETSFSENY